MTFSCAKIEKQTHISVFRIRIRPDPPVFGLSGSGSVENADPDPDPDPGWKCLFHLRFGKFFVLWIFLFFKFILKNAHFLNILVNFGSCGKMLKIFLFLNFFLKILLWLSLLTPWIRIRIRIRILGRIRIRIRFKIRRIRNPGYYFI